MVSQALISELQDIFREEYGLEMTNSEATAMAESMVKVYDTLSKISIKIKRTSDAPKTLPTK
jgi:hypothetical protein